MKIIILSLLLLTGCTTLHQVNVGKYGHLQNGWTENHDGLHGDGNYIAVDVHYDNYQAIKDIDGLVKRFDSIQ